jgi:hypothetical protein
MESGSCAAVNRDMPFSYEHAFRYETSLCSLAEGETLCPPRTAEDEAPQPRTTLLARLTLRRTTAPLHPAS